MRTLLLTMALALTPAFASASVDPVDAAKLEQMAKSANTTAEHANVAREYRLRSEALAAKADRHEEEARKMEARPRPPIAHKWPAMAPQPWLKERQLAIQARRASNEALLLADHHVRLSVETLSAAKKSEPPSSNDSAQ